MSDRLRRASSPATWRVERRHNTAAGLPGIEQHLLHRQSRLVIVQSVRVVQPANGEISFAELVLGEQ